MDAPAIHMTFQEKTKDAIYSRLQWLGRALNVDAVYFAESGFWLFLRRVVSIIAGFVLAIAFANFLSKEAYGTYKYILSVFTILSAFTLSGMNAAVNQAVASGFEKNLLEGYRLKFRWNFLASLISACVAAYYAYFGNYEFAAFYALFAVLFPFWDASVLFDDYLQGKADFKRSARFDIILQIALTLSLLGVIYLVPGNVLWLIIVWLFIQTGFSVAYYRKVSSSVSPESSLDSGALRYAKHLSFMNILGTVANQIENILLFKMLGAAQLAVYAFAIAIPEQIKGVLGNIGTMAFPRFAKKEIGEIRSFLKKKFFQLFLIGICVVGLYVLVAPYLYGAFFPKYEDSILYSQLFALSMLNMAFAPSAVALQAKKKLREQYISNIINPVFRIIITILFIVQWGILGLVFARIITRITGSIIDLLLLYYPSSEDVPSRS